MRMRMLCVCEPDVVKAVCRAAGLEDAIHRCNMHSAVHRSRVPLSVSGCRLHAQASKPHKMDSRQSQFPTQAHAWADFPGPTKMFETVVLNAHTAHLHCGSSVTLE